MAIATDEDRAFMAQQGFAIAGDDMFRHKDGRAITAVLVDPTDSRRGTFMGGYGVPKNREVMWHATKSATFNDASGRGFATRPVGAPCDSPTACFIQAEILLWT